MSFAAFISGWKVSVMLRANSGDCAATCFGCRVRRVQVISDSQGSVFRSAYIYMRVYWGLLGGNSHVLYVS